MLLKASEKAIESSQNSRLALRLFSHLKKRYYRTL